MPLKWLTASATQGAADAFKEQEVPTGLVNLGTTSYRIRRIEVQVPPFIAANSQDMLITLTRKSLAAIPELSAASLIAKVKRVKLVNTAVGTESNDLIHVFEYDRDTDLLIVEDPIYLQVDSTNTGVANVAYVRIGYELRNISNVERLSLIAQSLA